MRKYSLQRYKGQRSRHTCPRCGIKKSFVYYIDNETGFSLNNLVGRCNRESKCGYHYKPRHYFEDNRSLESYYDQIENCTPPKPIPFSYFDNKYLIETQTNHTNNNFIQFLLSKFVIDKVNLVVKKYKVGASNHWYGATVFWQLDKCNRVRNGKVMLYDKTTGKRIKINDRPLITSMRSILSKKGLININFNQSSGLFGEHLLKHNEKSIAIVESEKTAVISAIYFPQYLWLAAGSKSFLTNDRVKCLKGKDVVLYPDNDAYELWNQKALEYNFKISSLLLSKSDDPNYDLADYILETIKKYS